MTSTRQDGAEVRPLCRLSCHGQQLVGGAEDRREALLRVVGNADGELRLAGLVERAREVLAELLRAHGVELDRRDREPAALEGDRLRAGLAELDARLLEGDEVAERVGDRAEAVLELV